MIHPSNAWRRLRVAYRARREPESLRVLTEFYWHMLLITAAFIIIGITLYGFVRFTSVLRNPDEDIVTLSPNARVTSVLNRTEMEVLVGYFAERRTQYELLKKNPLQIADPSR